MLKDGVYPAITGGCVAVITQGDFNVHVKFPQGVRGFGLKDMVTVKDGKLSSSLLGEGGVIV